MCTGGEWVQPDPVSSQRLAGSPELSPSRYLPASLSSSVSRDSSPSFWSEKTRQEGSRWHWRSLLQWVLASLGIPTIQRVHGPDFHPLISRLRERILLWSCGHRNRYSVYGSLRTSPPGTLSPLPKPQNLLMVQPSMCERVSLCIQLSELP